MSVDTAITSVFDAGLPTIEYDVTATPAQVYPQLGDNRNSAVESQIGRRTNPLFLWSLMYGTLASAPRRRATV